MPTTYTHDIFGKLVSQKLPEEIRNLVVNHKNSFRIGLHGPDLLFYYMPFQQNAIHQQGVDMHDETASRFFMKCRDYYMETGDEEGLAYTIGFICHFMLDSTCHPYINHYMERTGARHDDIESELDRYLMERNGENPFRFKPARHLKATRESVRAIANILELSERQVRGALHGLKFFTNLCVCRSGLKRKTLLKMLQIIGFDEEVQGHIIHRRPIKRCEESTRELLSLFKLAVPETLTVIEDYYGTLEEGGYLNGRFERNYV